MTFAIGHLLRVPVDAAAEDHPIDTAESWMVQHNLYHCLTQCPQVLWSWCGLRDSADSSLALACVDGITARFAMPVRATWYQSARPANVFLQIKARNASLVSTVNVTARVVADSKSIGAADAPILLDAGGANIPSSTSSVVVSGFSGTTSSDGNLIQGLQEFAVLEEGVIRSVVAFFGRLEITMTVSGSDPEVLAEITRCTLWGFQ